MLGLGNFLFRFSIEMCTINNNYISILLISWLVIIIFIFFPGLQSLSMHMLYNQQIVTSELMFVDCWLFMPGISLELKSLKSWSKVPGAHKYQNIKWYKCYFTLNRNKIYFNFNWFQIEYFYVLFQIKKLTALVHLKSSKE